MPWLRRLLGNRTLVLLVVAAAFGTLAVTGARGYIAERLAREHQRLNPPRTMVDVVVAKRDLPLGAPVDADTMAVRQMPAEFAPGGAVGPGHFEHLAGARLGQPMRSGEPLLPAALEQGRDGSFSTRIRQGIRAMTIQVDEVNSVSGMLQPGDRIDLMFTVRPPTIPGRAPADEMTAPLMQDLPVLARAVRSLPAARRPGPAGHSPRSPSRFRPSRRSGLSSPSGSGRLTATLRHPDDRTPVRAAALDVSTMLGLHRRESRPPVPKPAGPELIIGGRGGPLRVVETSASAPAGASSAAGVAASAEASAAAPAASSAAATTAAVSEAARWSAVRPMPEAPVVLSGQKSGDLR